MSDITEIEPDAAFDPEEDEYEAADEYIAADEQNEVDELVQSLLELREAGIELIEEQRPVVEKRRPSEPVMPWEQYLQFLTQTPGKTVRLFRYSVAEHGEEARAKARRRAREVLRRLEKTNPTEIWSVTWDFVKEDESWRVYISYERERTETEMAEFNQKIVEAQERGRHAAAVRKAELEKTKAEAELDAVALAVAEEISGP